MKGFGFGVSGLGIRVRGSTFRVSRDMTSTMENQLERMIEHDMETGFMQKFVGLCNLIA